MFINALFAIAQYIQCDLYANDLECKISGSLALACTLLSGWFADKLIQGSLKSLFCIAIKEFS